MKDLRRRLACLAGLTSMVVAVALAACDDDPGIGLGSGLDASTADLDATVNPPGRLDGSQVPAVNADVASDFSLLANPNRAWTYGYVPRDPTSADAGAFVVFGEVANVSTGEASWHDPTNSVLGAPAAWRNDTGATSNGVAAGEFALHPGSAGEYAIVRWTAPAAGTYAVSVQFETGDKGDTNGLLLRNGVALVTEETTSTDAVHDLDVTLAAGDHLDVAVGSKGGFDYDSTPVRLSIRSK